jgi:subfamily B ATP-binding cassette protein MsbA
MKDVLKLFKLTFGEKKRLFLAFSSTLFVAFFTYVFVNLVQPIIDEMFLNVTHSAPEKTSFISLIFKHIHAAKEQFIWLIPLLLVIVIFGKGLFTFLSSFFMKSLGHRVVKKLRDELFGHIVYQSTNYFDHTSTGELMSRLTNDVDKIQEALSGSMSDFIEEVFVLFALLIYIFVTDWKLALFSFVIGPLAVIPLAAFSRQLKKKGLQNQRKMAQIYTLIHETITGNKIVKSFTMEKFEIKKFWQATMSYFKTSIKLAWIGSLSSPFMEFMGAVVGGFILYLGTKEIAKGSISPGHFVSFIAAIFYSYTPIKRLSRANNSIQQGVACYERIQEVLRDKPQIVEHPQAYALPPVKGNIRFEKVSFFYNEKLPVLHDIDFEVLPTERIALVGLSGAGKTTIINLLCRFYDPTSGKIIIDGIDTQGVTLSSLRSQIGLVTQELVLFNDTVRNNIAYGLEEKPLEEVIEAARAAKAHEFVMKLPSGYEANIGEKGTLLSSGERQRLAIARALLKNPPILILDEATSALDSESERLIQIALDNVMKDRTTFIIAHRLSTVRNADRIFVIDKGRITEIGTHAQLLKKKGIYKKLYDLQFLEEEEPWPSSRA